MTTLRKSLSLVKFLEKVSQFRWLGTQISSSPSIHLELGIEQMVIQEDSWMKIISKENFVSRIVLTIKLFLWTFCEKILISLIIINCYYSQLNELIVSCFHKSLNIPSNAILYWTYVTRENIHLNLLGNLLCSLSIWRSVGMVPLSLFLI